MNFKNLLLISALLNMFLVYSDNSSGSDHNQSINKHKNMLINRHKSLKLKIDKLEIIKKNTQNPFLYRQTIYDLEPLQKEVEVIEKMQIILDVCVKVK